ncbi:MAG: DUF3014 domain-containing protein [Rhodoferax sp.]|uniref:DUF3014 domain-containing protein n=1 Tax=Rhodoferax sp. TaxID=50421 RepID=UPI0027349F29|nr:DUF3014 domain-containing protein [Rhodoferax sp.]MDP2680462.1 DUF3014 domain-containing protein [Rhodoferax sp.]
MKKFTKTFWAIFGLVVLAGAAMIWWPSREAIMPLQAPSATSTLPLPAAPQTPAAAPASPSAIQHPIEAIPTQPAPTPVPLPALDAADAHVRRALAEFISGKDMLRYLQLDQFVRHVVATVDNLPRKHAYALVWPFNPIPGHFSTGKGDDSNPLGPTTIHPGNNARYTPFVNFVTAVDTARAVALYVQLYPLFQQAFVELGYPNGYFNDRLIAVIDHLLTAPVPSATLAVSRIEVMGPYQPVRPWVTYEFTDPALQAMSAGQKMLLRAGATNHQRLRTKLMDIRAHLTQTELATPGGPVPQ